MALARKTLPFEFNNTASDNRFNLLEQVALTAAESARTVDIVPNKRYAKLVVLLDYTAAGGGSTLVTVATSASLDGITFGRIQSRSIAAGVSTLTDFIDQKDATSSFTALLEFDIRGFRDIRLVFVGTGAPAAGDLIDVQCTVVAGS